MNRLLELTKVGEEGKCCAACMYPVPIQKMLLIRAEERPPRRSALPNNDVYLCHLCASTHAGNTIDYPDKYPDAHVMCHQNFCTNAMLDQMGAFCDTASLPDSTDNWREEGDYWKERHSKLSAEMHSRLRDAVQREKEWMDRALRAEESVTPATE